jgi:hypothetical protein
MTCQPREVLLLLASPAASFPPECFREARRMNGNGDLIIEPFDAWRSFA